MSLAEADIEYLREVVAERSGHMISAKQGYLFETRLRTLAKTEGHDTVQSFVSQLRQSRSMRDNDRVAEAMTINETFFFRDMHPFDALRNEIVPDLVARRNGSLKIWCAACSTGQEPYSIAISLKEHFPESVNWSIQIVATDLTDSVLEKAQEGIYTQFEVNRGLPAKLLVKYFDRNGAEWRVREDIRRMVEFRKLNLANRWPMLPRFDVVFLRNVLIYFSPATKESILQRVHQNMSQDGYLMLGGGETLLNLNASFTRETVGGTVCYRPGT